MKLLIKIILITVMYYSPITLANTLGDSASVLFEGASFLTKFFWAACILIGIFLLIGALVNYQSHRNNPKLVPMSTVITYLFLGILTISIPFLNKIIGTYDSYDTAQQQRPPSKYSD